MKKSGFTLVELLIVIAIIALLAAILFPVFASARAKGREAVCKSNLRQLLLAANLYSQDYDEKYLIRAWDTTIKPYVKHPKVFYCPASLKHWSVGVGLPPVILNEGDYTYNSLLRADGGPHSIAIISAVPYPAQTVWLGDGGFEQASAATTTDTPCDSPDEFRYIHPFCSNRHLGGTNIGFTDGHIKRFQMKRLDTLTQQKILIFLPQP